MLLFLFASSKRKEHWLVFAYIAYSFASTILLNKLIGTFSGKEFLAYRILTIVEGGCLIAYLSNVIRSINARRIMLLAGLIFLTVAVIDLTKSNAKTFDSYPTVIECLIIISFSIFYFFEQLKSTENLFLYNTADFWIVVGMVLFFSGSFFVFIYGQSKEFSRTFDLINTFLSFIENILFLIAFLIAKNQSKTLKPKTIVKN